jgi:hypothetical protein
VRWRARDFVQRQLRPRAGRPQLKRDPLGSHDLVNPSARALVTAVLAVLLTTCGRPAEDRARAYFAMAPNAPVDSTTLRSAVLKLLPLGTSQADVARRLAQGGIGEDSLSEYFPPDSTGRAVVRIEYDRHGSNPVQRSFGIVLQFDTARILRQVQVREWLTGP